MITTTGPTSDVLIRLNGWTPAKGREAVTRARGHIGDKYDFLGVVGAPSEKRWYCPVLATWSMGMAVNKPGVQHVLYPTELHHLGEFLWDTGARDGAQDKPASALVARAQQLQR